MPKICYVPRNFKPESRAIIDLANKIIAEYSAQGFELTLRQLYYQFVARDLLPNTFRSYKNLGSIVNDARLAGLIDWKAIVDRTRNLEGNSHWESPADIVRSCAKQCQIDKWTTQNFHVEVWIEKDALIGVIEDVCRRNDVSFFSCRGYASQSEVWSAAMRLKNHEKLGKETAVIHLGDHDPSGKDMSRDIENRFRIFGVKTTVERIALNMAQVKKYKLPPNPAKKTDSRFDRYATEHGKRSWELDALEPQVLASLIDKSIMGFRNDTQWREAMRVEEKHKLRLANVADDLENDEKIEGEIE